jgi:phosphate acetyltransferase
MAFIHTVFEKLQRHPKRIVFPEGNDPRIIQAAGEYVKRKLGPAILLGKRDEIAEIASQHGVGLVFINVIDPEKADDLDLFCDRLKKLPKYRDIADEEARKMMAIPNYFAAMMLQYGQVDGMVGGASSASVSLLRPLFSLIKPLPGVPSVSSCMVIQVQNKQLAHKGLFFFADCGVIPEPTVDQLAVIALEAAQLSRQLTGEKPHVAFLSFSTRNSAKTRATEKTIAATVLAQQRARDQDLEIEIDGELQVDAAIVPEIAQQKAPDSPLKGQANVLIFPDLNSGDIATKLVQRLAKADAYGRILMGLSKPAADISRGSTVQDIVGVSAIVGLRAVAYRQLYPDQGVRLTTTIQ